MIVTRNCSRWLGLVVAATVAVSFARAACNERFLSDGDCDPDNNTAECFFDGGDCCACTCEDSEFYSCKYSQFACIDPDASCVDDDDVTAGTCLLAGDSICDERNNNEECGYDGGDCCPCTCEDETRCGSSVDFRSGGFNCVDPEAQCDDDGDGDDGGAEEGEETAESSSTYEEYDREDEDGGAIPLDEDDEIEAPPADEKSDDDVMEETDDETVEESDDEVAEETDDEIVEESDDEAAEETEDDAVEVGTKTGVSVVATAHDERPGRSSDEVGCGETGEGGCEPYLAHDGVSDEIESRWSCATKIVEGGGPCEIEFLFDEPQDIVDIRVAFWKGTLRTRTLEVKLNGEHTHTHESYADDFFNSLGVEADGVNVVTLESVLLKPDEWISLIEVEIMVKP